jgi:hypothetical protein
MITPRPTIAEAVWYLTDNASFKVNGDTYESVEWLDKEQSLPPKDAVLAKLAELQAQYDIDEQAKLDKKQAALAKLAALGLTEEEFKTLIGN